MAIYAIISLFLIKISIGYLGFKLYKLKKEMKNLKEENEKFKREIEVKRNIGFDSIWKVVNGRS